MAERKRTDSAPKVGETQPIVFRLMTNSPYGSQFLDGSDRGKELEKGAEARPLRIGCY